MAFTDDEIADSFAEATLSGSDFASAVAILEAGRDDAGGTTKKTLRGVSVVHRPNEIGSEYKTLTAEQRYANMQIDALKVGRDARKLLRDYARAELWNRRLSRRIPYRRIWQIVRGRQSERELAIRLMGMLAYRQKHRRRADINRRKLTNLQALQIRYDYHAGLGGYKALAHKYGVAVYLVNQIVHGDTYKNAGGPIVRPGLAALYANPDGEA